MPRRLATLAAAACLAAFLQTQESAAAGWWPPEEPAAPSSSSSGAGSAEADDADPDALLEGFHSDIDSISVAVGAHHTCALEYRPGASFGGPVRCWGMDSWGQGSPPDGLFMQLSAGRRHTCGVRADQTLACWGSSSWAPEGLWQQVSVGAHHTCALSADGYARCWGSDHDGTVSPPQDVALVQVTSGGDVSCGLRRNGLAVCWGSNFRGQATPPRGVRFRQLSASSSQHVCGITLADDIVCWGRNMGGEAGFRQGPWRQVSCAQWRTCAIHGASPDAAAAEAEAASSGESDASSGFESSSSSGSGFGSNSGGSGSGSSGSGREGSIECWGVLSQDLRISASEAQGAYEELSTNDYHTCAVTTEGELRCWGDSASTQHGSSRVPDGFEVA